MKNLHKIRSKDLEFLKTSGIINKNTIYQEDGFADDGSPLYTVFLIIQKMQIMPMMSFMAIKRTSIKARK